MAYIYSITHLIDTDIQTTSGIRILVSTEGGKWSDDYSISTNTNLGDSDLILATQNAIKSYVDSKQKWQQNEFGLYTTEKVYIGEVPSFSYPQELIVSGEIRVNSISLLQDIIVSEDHGLDWGSGDSYVYMGSDGLLHVRGMDGINFYTQSGNIMSMNSHGLGIGGIASTGEKLRVFGNAYAETLNITDTSYPFQIRVDTSIPSIYRVLYDSTDLPQAFLQNGKGVELSAGGVNIWPYQYNDPTLDIGLPTCPFRFGYFKYATIEDKQLIMKGPETFITTDTEDAHLIIKTVAGNGKVKMNKAMGFQLTQMDGGQLDVEDEYVPIGRQLVPPEMDGMVLVGVYVSCANPGNQDIFIHVKRTPGNSISAAYNNLILEDSAIHQTTDPFVVSTGIMVASPIVSDMDVITIFARYDKTPVTLAEEVVVTLMFDIA